MIVRVTRIDNGDFHDYQDMDNFSLRIHTLVMNRISFTVEYL